MEKNKKTTPRRNNNKIWLGVGLGVLIIIGFSIYQLVHSNGGVSIEGLNPREVQANDWVQGDKNAPVTLIEYADFQCPACRAYEPLLKQLEQELAGQIRIVYRYFPLEKIHRYAKNVAIAAEAAGRQGKFWEMHDLLFEKQNEWSSSANIDMQSEEYAQSIHLNIEQFRKDLADNAVRLRVERDRRLGESLQVNSTPTFYLNGVQLQNPKDYPEFKKIVELVIQNSQSKAK